MTLVRLLLVPLVIFFALRVPAVILYALPLATIGLLMLIMLLDIVVTYAIMLRDLVVVTNALVVREIAQHRIEASGPRRAGSQQHAGQPRLQYRLRQQLLPDRKLRPAGLRLRHAAHQPVVHRGLRGPLGQRD